MEISKLTIEDVCKILVEQSVSEQIVQSFRSNGISGEIFESLTEENIKEVVPKIVDRVKVRNIEEKCRQSEPGAKVCCYLLV